MLLSLFPQAGFIPAICWIGGCQPTYTLLIREGSMKPRVNDVDCLIHAYEPLVFLEEFTQAI